MATWGQFMFMDANSPMMEELFFFHDHVLMSISIITLLVAFLVSNLFINRFYNKYYIANQTLETLWTVMPMFALGAVALPSLRLLYLLDEAFFTSLTVKVTGHQWYWSYELSILPGYTYDSYMIKTIDLKFNSFRLLEVDHRLILPSSTKIKIIVTAADVIHSWTVPSLGIKMDATPGRLNQIYTYLTRSGLFYGQCSEICGINHSFMPICLEVIPMNYFLESYIKN